MVCGARGNCLIKECNDVAVCRVWRYGRSSLVESSWNVMAHGEARVEKWRGNKRMEWVTSKRHMTAEHRIAWAVQGLQAEVHSSPTSSRVNWRPRLFKWTRPFRRKTKYGSCACAITFQTQSTQVSKNTTRYELLLRACAFTCGWRRSGSRWQTNCTSRGARFWRGWTFAPVDCGDEVKELRALVHFLSPATRREHVMS